MSAVSYNERLYFLPKAYKFLLPDQVPLLDFPLPPEAQVRPYTDRFAGPWKYNSAFSNRNDSQQGHDACECPEQGFSPMTNL
ncbi:hypothetical protein Tdes44962_MAKER05229 [Teratosphaeria destructans]|uniref:Uncharacterized protein n=1 Tax=Teratosphaeria destructans TaxID=418781 RepID=A0A9W7SKE1_9PEZI|nr:hypothetical protein Tdes44962_MAKER05229 [Teratosphaeria destructans]